MEIDSSELSTYIKAVLEGITKNIPVGFAITNPIKFQIGLQNVGEKEGGLKLMVIGVGAGVGGKRSNKEHVKVEFEIEPDFRTSERAFDMVKKMAEIKEISTRVQWMPLEAITNMNERLTKMFKDLTPNKS